MNESAHIFQVQQIDLPLQIAKPRLAHAPLLLGRAAALHLLNVLWGYWLRIARDRLRAGQERRVVQLVGNQCRRRHGRTGRRGEEAPESLCWESS